MPIEDYEIRLARDESERVGAFRLRYELYVEQQGLFADTADHERRELRDEADVHGAIMVAVHDGEVVGTSRAHWAGEDGFDHEARETFDIDGFLDVVTESEIAIASRMLVRPEHRQIPLPIMLLASTLELLVERGTELFIGECEPHLVNKWMGLGFRPYGLCEHPTNGTLVRIAMVIGDHKYAHSVGSPVAAAMSKWNKAGFAPRRLAARLARSQRIVSEAKDKELFWAAVEDTLPLEQVAELLGDLSVDELDALLGSSHALDCKPGSALIRKGHASRTLYVLLTGSLEVWDEGRRVIEVDEPCAVLGEVAFFSRSKRMSDVVAGSGGARVLALSERNLKKLITTQGPGAAKFMLAVTRGLSRKLRQRKRETSAPS